MPKFRKKPVVIEAYQWTGGFNGMGYNADVWRYQDSRRDDLKRPCQHCNVAMGEHGWIDTLEGGHIVCPGDFIITGVEGERYPCKPDIFAKTYEAV